MSEAPRTSPTKLITYKNIATFLGCSTRMVIIYARLAEDPLPLRVRKGIVWVRSDYAAEWNERRKLGKGGLHLPRVEGWAAISAALDGYDRRATIWLAERRYDRLPVIGMRTRRPWIYASALRDWVQRNDIPWQLMDNMSMVLRGGGDIGRLHPFTCRRWIPSKEGDTKRSACKL